MMKYTGNCNDVSLLYISKGKSEFGLVIFSSQNVSKLRHLALKNSFFE